MSPSLTASSSSSPRTLSTPRNSDSTAASSTVSSPPSTPPSKALRHVNLMLDTTPPPDPLREERIKASRRRMKRYVFDYTTRVDWKSIPTFDEAEDNTFDYASLSRRPDLWCDASGKYREHVVRKYREPLVMDFKFEGSRMYENGEEVVDMIG